MYLWIKKFVFYKSEHLLFVYVFFTGHNQLLTCADIWLMNFFMLKMMEF